MTKYCKPSQEEGEASSEYAFDLSMATVTAKEEKEKKAENKKDE